MKVAELVRRIQHLPTPLLLAFDVDGTLAAVTQDPNATTLEPDVVQLVQQLAAKPDVEVAIVTGRDQRALERMLDLPEVWRVMEHGGVVLAPGESSGGEVVSAADMQRLDEFADWVRATLLPQGVDLEEKRTARGVHVRRLAETDPAKAEAAIAQARRQAKRMGLHAREGRMMLEADANRHDKGTALELLWRTTQARGVAYFGDDITDFPAIRRARALGGIGVFVRSPERVSGPRAFVLSEQLLMRQVLEQLVEIL